MVKSLPAIQETWVWSLGWEDPLDKAMETYSSILAWRIPWTEESGGLQSVGLQELDTTEGLTLSLIYVCVCVCVCVCVYVYMCTHTYTLKIYTYEKYTYSYPYTRLI